MSEFLLCLCLTIEVSYSGLVLKLFERDEARFLGLDYWLGPTAEGHVGPKTRAGIATCCDQCFSSCYAKFQTRFALKVPLSSFCSPFAQRGFYTKFGLRLVNGAVGTLASPM